MLFLYNLAIHIYLLGIRIASLFNTKAGLWLEGRRDIFVRIEDALSEINKEKKYKIAWFHCASLGEFEQGRPIIDQFKTQFPEFKIFLTFFSPSGYEIRKNYQEADFIFYLPGDTMKNAQRFVSLLHPQMVFFVKYDYWFNYLKILNQKKVPTYFISAIFRPGQYFFKRYGKWFRKQLRSIDWFFLQDENSAKLLLNIGINSFSVTGDTRFDRVDAIVKHLQSFPLVERFCGNSKIILGGSTWPADEQLLISLMKLIDEKVRFIIAPHETDPARITSLISQLPLSCIKYSDLTNENFNHYRIMVIDCIGILSHLYKYATIAYIGGGFGAGIHNILEAAAFGVPVIFGPNYSSFREAKDLISLGGAFSINDASRFKQIVNYLLTESDGYIKASDISRDYVLQNKGSTEKIMKKIHG